MIEVREQFDVSAPPDVVWRLLADPPAIIGCVPGAALVGQQPDGSMDVTLSVKFGPVSVAFEAKATLDLDAASMQGRVSSTGKDKMGGARFTATSSFEVHPEGEGSRVSTSGQVEITGRMASLIESGATNVVKRMSADFAACLSQRAAAALKP